MKQKFIPLEKQSKRKQREWYARQRGTWGEMKPVTNRIESAKRYSRKKSKQRCEYEPPAFGFFVYIGASTIVNSL
ncbi:MAG: hypothetical protein FWC16_03495 [Defluviitaleaceae bacterium]|nr:hypothetical protein [Defluviitaleaceae bacterium]MCL2273967.1 hypothetical protein [Defluviitaleaceae bacterium]